MSSANLTCGTTPHILPYLIITLEMMDGPSGKAAGLGEWRQLFFDTLGLDLTSAPAAAAYQHLRA